MDHRSGLICNYNRVGLGATDTKRGKERFEFEANDTGVNVHSYHDDNGIYKSKEFQKFLELRHQILILSGVGLHGKNELVERRVQTEVNSSRTIMLYQALMRPE